MPCGSPEPAPDPGAFEGDDSGESPGLDPELEPAFVSESAKVDPPSPDGLKGSADPSESPTGSAVAFESRPPEPVAASCWEPSDEPVPERLLSVPIDPEDADEDVEDGDDELSGFCGLNGSVDPAESALPDPDGANGSAEPLEPAPEPNGSKLPEPGDPELAEPSGSPPSGSGVPESEPAVRAGRTGAARLPVHELIARVAAGRRSERVAARVS